MKARLNPFATDCVLKVRYKLTETEWQEVLCRFAALKFRAAIVGPHGSGKTTLLEDLAGRLAGSGFDPVFWRQNCRGTQPTVAELKGFFAKLTNRHLCCIDSAESLNLRAWLLIRYLSRRVGGLVVTLHHESRLPTLIRCETNPELLKSIICELLPDACPPDDRAVVQLYRRHSGNIRSALRECYLSFASEN